MEKTQNPPTLIVKPPVITTPKQHFNRDGLNTELGEVGEKGPNPGFRVGMDRGDRQDVESVSDPLYMASKQHGSLPAR